MPTFAFLASAVLLAVGSKAARDRSVCTAARAFVERADFSVGEVPAVARAFFVLASTAPRAPIFALPLAAVFVPLVGLRADAFARLVSAALASAGLALDAFATLGFSFRRPVAGVRDFCCARRGAFGHVRKLLLACARNQAGAA